jgi:hypothetical protein
MSRRRAAKKPKRLRARQGDPALFDFYEVPLPPQRKELDQTDYPLAGPLRADLVSSKEL